MDFTEERLQAVHPADPAFVEDSRVQVLLQAAMARPQSLLHLFFDARPPEPSGLREDPRHVLKIEVDGILKRFGRVVELKFEGQSPRREAVLKRGARVRPAQTPLEDPELEPFQDAID